MPWGDLSECGCGYVRQALLAFAKPVINQGGERIDTCLLIIALGFQGHFRALAGGQHHDAHDGLGVDAARVAGQPDVALELGGELGKFGGGACVQSQLVDDFEFSLNHFCMVSIPECTTLMTILAYKTRRLQGGGHALPYSPTRMRLSTRTAPLCAPASAISTTTSSVSRRYVMARSSIGKLMPAITSTRPASASRLQQFAGVPPLTSVITSTPSPMSRRLIAAAASVWTSPRSWSAITSIASRCSVGPRNTWAQAAKKACPSGACVISSMPTILLNRQSG